MWNCGVLLLCVCVMIPQGALCKFTDVKNFRGVERRGSFVRRSQRLTEKWQPNPRPTSLTPTMAREFQIKLKGFKDNKTCPDNEICASKCCPIGQGFDFSEDKCRALSREFIPPIEGNYSEINVSKNFHILEGIIGCSRNKSGKKEFKRLMSELKQDFYLLTNGSLFMESDRAAGPGMIFNQDKYCIDLFITDNNKTEWDAIICHVPSPFKMHRVLTIACILITCVLVLLRVAAFAWLHELRTLHGKILLAYLISFFVSMLLIASRMLLMNANKINREACSVLSFIVYFVTLSAFFWRNVMCYDIWWTFSGKRAKSGRGSSSRTRFCLYCVYAFGWPTALTVLMAALEFSELSDEHPLMPKVWHHGCNRLDGYTRLTYYYGPIFTLFVINMILFGLTALKIAAIKKETRTVLKSKESGTHDRKNDIERFMLYGNLFASMLFLEVNWIFDSVTIFYPDAKNVSRITDFCYLAILLFIFFNFVCKKRTWMMLKKRYQHMRGRSMLTTVTSNNRTLTSQISQISVSQDYTITTDQWKPAESQNEIQSTDFIQEKSSLAESQQDNITNKYSRDSQNPAVSQDNIQSPDFILRKTSPAENQGETQSPDVIQKNLTFAERQVTQSSEFIRKKSSLAEKQDNTQSPNFSREKLTPVKSPIEIQENTQSPDFIREKSSPAESQEDTQSLDFIREKLSSTESQEDTQSLDFIREKSSSTESQKDTLSLDFIREKSSSTESQEYTQSLDFIREKSSSTESQKDTLSLDFIREKSSSTESQEDTQSLDFIREKSSSTESQKDTLSLDFIRKKSSSTESQEDTRSFDFIKEKLSSAESQEDTQSLDFIREKSSSAESQEDTQSLDFIREKSSSAESQEDTQSLDFIREKLSSAESQEDTQSLDFSVHKTFPNEEPEDTQAPKIIVEAQTIVIARNALYQPTSFERSRTLPRPGAALNHLTALEKRGSLLRSSLRDPSFDTDGATFQLFKGSV